MKVLLIGGTRFLGLAIANALHRHGHKAVVAHRGHTKAALPETAREIHVDVADQKSLENCLLAEQYDAVVDTILGAKTLEWMVTTLNGRIRQFVHCGSTGVYAPMKRIPATEEDPCEALPQYGGFGAKLEQDEVLMRAHRQTGFPATVLRPTNIYGAGDIPLDIWGARNPAFFRRLTRNQPVTLPNDGRALLQPGHVSELGEAFALALESPHSIGRIYNISSARAVELRVYLDILKGILKSSSPVDFASAELLLERYLPENKINEGGLRFVVEHMCVDISRARAELGFDPQISLEEGLAENLQWMCEKGLI
ncbi:MAG TPA: NAD-dependent epimerase/dehydratase family protein [Candidatus Latescibacteria bacterium]|nr:NAD-dependent epimerase/dehydratase family protein [Candidatus Latescibacterota bacterium]HOS63815.1 NAD-dependent epimerase/dehydratase family protein [Candidatus Latescibacterota bacterium]HPK73896.1 NAD-dependent epimerase/dehydratase family protein [Candidatus Latescibacterota bacterium]